MSKKKPTWVEILEKRIAELTEKVSELDRKFDEDFENLREYLGLMDRIIYNDMISMDIIGHLFSYRSGNTTQFDRLIDELKEKEQHLEKSRSLGFPSVNIVSTAFIDKLLTISRTWEIPFEDVGSYLIKKLGKNLAKKLVKKETVMKNYGKDVVPIWESLLE